VRVIGNLLLYKQNPFPIEFCNGLLDVMALSIIFLKLGYEGGTLREHEGIQRAQSREQRAKKRVQSEILLCYLLIVLLLPLRGARD
jgi:hypothetical protein